MHDHTHHGHDHDHGHSHAGHGHHHGHHHHDHGSFDASRAFFIGITLNTLFILCEVAFGLRAHSMALLADAGHNVSDVLGLFMAWGAHWVGKLRPTSRFTYGLRGSSILAALANAAFLLIVTGGIAWEAAIRLFHPQPVSGGIVMVIAAAGIVVNGGSALLFMKGRSGDLNIRAAFLHLLSDMAVSAGVVVSGLIILYTGWLRLDPIVSLVISAFIIASTWGLLKDSVGLALQAVPSQIDPGAVRQYLEGVPDVDSVHDLHIWAMSTSEIALSAHLRMRDGHPGDQFLCDIAESLREKFAIGHATIQIELGDAADCPLAPTDTV